MSEARPLVEDIFERFLDKVRKRKIVENKQLDKIDGLKLEKLRDIKLLLTRNFKQNYQNSKKIAQNELDRSDFRALNIEDSFLQFLDQETFQFVGEWEFEVTKGARQALREAIRDGSPFTNVISFINEKSKRQAMVSLERFSRTKTTEVFNRGRLDFFNSSGIVAGYQYSAILDGRTSVICAGLHGKKFKAGKEPIPPMHFNCRSVLIPITKFEDFKEDKTVGGTVQTRRGDAIKVPTKKIDDFIKEHKGDGFSRR